MRALLDYYWTNAKLSVIEQFQYPVANYFYMIGMIAEPVIYLVVWSTVARAQGGEIGGYTAAQFAGYYIIWTLVRQFNLTLGPHNFNWRIKEGRLAAELQAVRGRSAHAALSPRSDLQASGTRFRGAGAF